MSQLRLPIRQVQARISRERFMDLLWGFKCSFKIEETYGLGVINKRAALKVAEGLRLSDLEGEQALKEFIAAEFNKDLKYMIGLFSDLQPITSKPGRIYVL